MIDEEFSKWAEKEWFTKELIDLVDEDTNSFNKIIKTRLPKDSEEDSKTDPNNSGQLNSLR